MTKHTTIVVIGSLRVNILSAFAPHGYLVDKLNGSSPFLHFMGIIYTW